MDLKLLKMLCKDSKQHHVVFHELCSVGSLLCVARGVRFEIPYKVLCFETPFLIIFKYYAWVSCDVNSHTCELCSCILIDVLSLLWRGQAVVTVVFEAFTMYLVLYKHFFRVTSAHSPKKCKSKDLSVMPCGLHEGSNLCSVTQL